MSLSHDSSSGAGMALAGSRTRQKQRIPWKFDGISGITCRSLAQYITHKAHSPRNLFPGTLTGCHSGDGRHWVRLHWLAAGGQLGRSQRMTSRDRVLATTILLVYFVNVILQYDLLLLSVTLIEHIEANTKWAAFRRRHFETYFLPWNCLNFN